MIYIERACACVGVTKTTIISIDLVALGEAERAANAENAMATTTATVTMATLASDRLCMRVSLCTHLVFLISMFA
jgi:hypothetical protein